MNIKRFALGPILTNGYLVSDGGGNAVFIDPAAEIATITRWAEQNALKLKAVLLTHGHIDHVAGLGEDDFAGAAIGDEIYLNAGDEGMVTNPDRDFGRRFGLDFEGISSYKRINDGDELSFGGLNVRVIATPGHTRGSVCFLVSEDGGGPALFSGDTLFAQSVGRTDLPGGDSAVLSESLKKIAALPPELTVYPGHGPSTTLSKEARMNPFWPVGQF